jgi:hypothetical protein
MEILNNSMTLKVEKENAWGMIEGFKFENKRQFITIFTSHTNAWSLKGDFRRNPKILSLSKNHRPEYITNNIIVDYSIVKNYQPNLKYIAVLDRIFHIESNLKLWETLCNNGIFNIWDPRAPLRSLDGKTDQMILLMRIFEIDYNFSADLHNDGYFDSVPIKYLNIIRPIIPQNSDDKFSKNFNEVEYFDEIVKKIQDSIGNSLIFEESVRDTSKIG